MSENKQKTLQAIEKLLRGFHSKCVKNKKGCRLLIKNYKIDLTFGTINRVSVVKMVRMIDTPIKDTDLLKFLEENKSTIEGGMK